MTERPDIKEMPTPAVEHEQATEKDPNAQPGTDACPVGGCGTGPTFPPSDPNGPQNA